MATSTVLPPYRVRLAGWSRAIARARLALANARRTRDQRMRARIVATARWGAANTGRIHYAETRPIPLQASGVLPALPFATDCSGFVTMCYRAAGAPDPNADSYSGQGYTGTLLDHGARVPVAAPGDVVIYGGGTGHHAALVVAGGIDPLTVSHGSEQGPMLIRVSEEKRYQPPGVTFLRFPV